MNYFKKSCTLTYDYAGTYIAKEKFGKNLKKIREAKKMSLLAVSYNCALDNSNISKIEQGKYNVTLGTIVELAKGLEIEPARLLEF